MKWEQAMAAHGLTEQTVSNSVRDKIADYRQYSETLQQFRQEKKAGGLDEKRAKKVDSNIETLEKTILALDAQLVKDMDRLHRNADRYKQMATRLPNRQGAKKGQGAKTAAPAQTTVAAAGTETAAAPAETKTATPPAATKKIETPPSPAPPKKKQEPAAGEKKGNGWGLALGITLTVLTLGTIGYIKFFKNK